jgi:hypothetical protein
MTLNMKGVSGNAFGLKSLRLTVQRARLEKLMVPFVQHSIFSMKRVQHRFYYSTPLDSVVNQKILLYASTLFLSDSF